jgi:hypothetical protein
MGQVDENLEAILDDLMALAALDVRNQANAAGVMFEFGIV